MAAVAKAPRFFTTGGVVAELRAAGLGRSATVIRRLEARGVVSPIRTEGHDRRLFSEGDVEALKSAIRGGNGSAAAE